MAGAALGAAAGSPSGRSMWRRVFAAMPASLAARVDQPEHAVQLRWTRVARARSGAVALTTFDYGVLPARWFPAASVAKLPMALLMAEALQECGGDLRSALRLHRPPATGEWPETEPLAETFGRGLNRTFAVSDNPPFNRWYELLGADRIHARLSALGYPHTRLVGRLGSTDIAANQRSGGGMALGAGGVALRTFPPSVSQARTFPFGRALSGSGWQNEDGSIVPGAHDFSHANFLPLSDSLTMLQALLLPQTVPPPRRWRIDGAMRAGILHALALRPRDSGDPVYPEADYGDGYARWFFVGDGRERYPQELTVFGKSGMAYGSLSEVAYVVDRDTGAEFMLAASIQANADGIYNDDSYEYETVAQPFMAALARAVLALERAET